MPLLHARMEALGITLFSSRKVIGSCGRKMPWKLIPGALSRLRKARKLSRPEAARLSGMAHWTVIRHERPKKDSPLFLQKATVDAYAKLYRCDPEEFVIWVDYDEVTAERALEQELDSSPIIPGRVPIVV